MKLKILLVDDDEKLLSVLKSILEEEEHEVIGCSNGLIAIEKCKQDKFDLVITDLKMPGADGLQVLKETRELNPAILVVLITGFASLETAIQAIRDGAYDYITKPFKLEEIKIIVKNIQEKIGLERENQRLFQELQEANKQLNIMKQIMETQEKTVRAFESQKEKTGPFIAGSMLPLYYSENRTGATPPSVISDLERISSLKEKGYLSEEEFNLCKSRLIRDTKH